MLSRTLCDIPYERIFGEYILQSEYVINPTKFTLFQFQFLFLKRSWQLLAMLWITSSHPLFQWNIVSPVEYHSL